MGLMSDLKEFGQNFVLSAGTQIAENIKRKGEEDRKAVTEHVKLLRSNIAKNKALDNKIKAGLQGQLNFLTSNLPDAPVGFYKDAMSSDENFAAVKKAIQADTNKTGYWFKDMAKQYNIANPEDIYKASDRKKVKLSDIRTSKGTYAPAVEEEEKDMSLKDIFKLGFGVPDPVESMRRAERRIVASGRGTLLEPDTQYAYGTPTRGIQPSGLPFSLRGKRTAMSVSQDVATALTMQDKDAQALAQPIAVRNILAPLYKEQAKLQSEFVKTYKSRAEEAGKKFTDKMEKLNKKIVEIENEMYVDTTTRLNKALEEIAKNNRDPKEILKILGKDATEADALKLIDKYRNNLITFARSSGADRRTMQEKAKDPRRSILGNE